MVTPDSGHPKLSYIIGHKQTFGQVFSKMTLTPNSGQPRVFHQGTKGLLL
jgi:hypothetical protein